MTLTPLPKQFIPELIQLHRDGRFPIDKICKVYPVKDFEQALHDMHEGKVRKALCAKPYPGEYMHGFVHADRMIPQVIKPIIEWD